MCEVISANFHVLNGWDCMDWPQVTWASCEPTLSTYLIWNKCIIYVKMVWARIIKYVNILLLLPFLFFSFFSFFGLVLLLRPCSKGLIKHRVLEVFSISKAISKFSEIGIFTIISWWHYLLMALAMVWGSSLGRWFGGLWAVVGLFSFEFRLLIHGSINGQGTTFGTKDLTFTMIYYHLLNNF